MVLYGRCKLVGHLCSDEGIGDVFLFKILVQTNQVEAKFFRNDIDGSTAGQRWIDALLVHVEAIAGIDCHMVFGLQAVVLPVPVAVADKIRVHQLATLGHTGRTAGIEQDKQAVGVRTFGQFLCWWQFLQVACQQDVTLIFIHEVTQFSVGNDQFCTRILYHEVQALLGITRVKRLISTASLQDTERGDDHPLATGNDDADSILQSQAFRCDISGNTVTQLIHFPVRIAVVLEHHGHLVGRSLCLTAEQ